MSVKIGEMARKKLETCHPDLRKVIERAAAIGDVEFTVLEGIRTIERQKKLVASGASTTMNSRHLPGPDGFSRAVDVAPLDHGDVSWAWPLYFKLAPIIKQAAKDVGVAIEWGGDWKTFKDGPHWQLPYAKYP